MKQKGLRIRSCWVAILGLTLLPLLPVQAAQADLDQKKSIIESALIQKIDALIDKVDNLDFSVANTLHIKKGCPKNNPNKHDYPLLFKLDTLINGLNDLQRGESQQCLNIESSDLNMHLKDLVRRQFQTFDRIVVDGLLPFESVDLIVKLLSAKGVMKWQLPLPAIKNDDNLQEPVLMGKTALLQVGSIKNLRLWPTTLLEMRSYAQAAVQGRHATTALRMKFGGPPVIDSILVPSQLREEEDALLQQRIEPYACLIAEFLPGMQVSWQVADDQKEAKHIRVTAKPEKDYVAYLSKEQKLQQNLHRKTDEWITKLAQQKSKPYHLVLGAGNEDEEAAVFSKQGWIVLDNGVTKLDSNGPAFFYLDFNNLPALQRLATKLSGRFQTIALDTRVFHFVRWSENHLKTLHRLLAPGGQLIVDQEDIWLVPGNFDDTTESKLWLLANLLAQGVPLNKVFEQVVHTLKNDSIMLGNVGFLLRHEAAQFLRRPLEDLSEEQYEITWKKKAQGQYNMFWNMIIKTNQKTLQSAGFVTALQRGPYLSGVQHGGRTVISYEGVDNWGGAFVHQHGYYIVATKPAMPMRSP